MTIKHDEPFPPSAPLLPGLVGGGLVLLADSVVWALLFRGQTNSAAQLLSPLACLGHALAVWCLTGLVFEAWRLHRCRQALRQVPSSGRDNWAERAWQTCHLSTGPGGKDSRETAEGQCRSWSRELDLRWWGYFGTALAPFLLGGLLGLQNLHRDAEATGSFADLFLPLTVGSVQTLLVGLAAYRIRLGWNRLFNEWLLALPRGIQQQALTHTDREAVLRRREEDLARREIEVEMRERALQARQSASAYRPAGTSAGVVPYGDEDTDPLPPSDRLLNHEDAKRLELPRSLKDDEV
jgi:hypothetical protein